MSINKQIYGKKLAYLSGALISIVSIGVIAVIATNSSNNIPDDVPNTLGNAFVKILGANWETSTWVLKTNRLAGIDGSKYIQTPTGTIICGKDASNKDKLLNWIGYNGTYGCVDPNPNTRPKAILATIRDISDTCIGSVKINGNPVGTTEAQDIQEGDKLETGGCSMSSLYFVDHSIVRLAANTTITLRSAGTPSGSGATDVTLNQGELWARVLKPITDDSYFNISSEEGSVGVRGTSVHIKRNNNSTPYDTLDDTLDAIPMDSGTLTDPNSSSGVIALLATGAIQKQLVPLKKKVKMKKTTVKVQDYKDKKKDFKTQKDNGLGSLLYTKLMIELDDSFDGIREDSTQTPNAIYDTNEFVRLATLADLKDWDDLYRFDRGNLKAISMNGSWLRTNSGALRTGSGYTNLPTNSINPTETKVLNEFTRTEPTGNTSEINALCPGQGKYISKYIGCLNPGDYGVDFTSTGDLTYSLLDYTGSKVFSPISSFFDAPTATGYAYKSLLSSGSNLLQYPLNNRSGSTIEVNVGEYTAKKLDVVAVISCTNGNNNPIIYQGINSTPLFSQPQTIPGDTCTLTLGRNTLLNNTGDSTRFKGSIRSLIIHYAPQLS